MKPCAMLLALLAATAHAGVIGVVDARHGRIDLYDDKGSCVRNAYRAEFVPRTGPAIQGCWVVTDGEVVQVAFMDGDAIAFHASVIRPPAMT